MPGDTLSWRQLGLQDKLTVAAFACALPLISLGLRALGYKRTRAMLGRLPSRPTVAQLLGVDWVARGHHWAHLARLGARWTPANTSCLRQAMLVHALLRHHGLQPLIQFGVDGGNGSMDMHAWVELDGQPLGQPGLRHKPFQQT